MIPAWIRTTKGKMGGVVFLTHSLGRHSFDAIIGRDNTIPIGVIDYNRLSLLPSFSARMVVVCDIERLSPEQEHRVGVAVKNWVSSGDGPLVFNAPPKAKRRYEILKTLYRNGVNRKNVFRLDDPYLFDEIQFPCFICDENSHNLSGQPPRLLNAKDELVSEIQALKENGTPAFGKIAVEWEDTRDASGLYSKLSYFNVGGELIPGHRLFNDNWFVKTPNARLLDQNSDLARREETFIQEQPYKDGIASIFELAGIDYGRVDFAEVENGLHIFEVNTNPNLPQAGAAHPSRKHIIAAVQRRISEKLRSLASTQQAVSLKPPENEYFARLRHRIKRSQQ